MRIIGIAQAKILLDFIQAIGYICGIWLVDGSTASELPQATSILGKDLSGNSSSWRLTLILA